MAIGLVLVAFAAIGALVLIVTGGDDDSASDEPSAQVKKIQDQVLKHTVVNPSAGISVRRPRAWSDTKHGNAITLQSKSRCVSMTLAAPTAAGNANKLLHTSVAAIRESQKGVTFRRAGTGEVGGIPSSSFQAAFKNQKGDEVRLLLSVGKGKRNAYLTETVLGNATCRQDLAAAQVILTSVQYTK